jgi:dihydroorotase-like cyclic amidohydrolase
MAKIGFASSKIIALEREVPSPGLILVEGEFIRELLWETEEKGLQILIEEHAEWSITDYGELCIAPGMIDLNVKPNGEWEGMSMTSKAAVSGGVTFFLENPNLFEMPEERNPEVY